MEVEEIDKIIFQRKLMVFGRQTYDLLKCSKFKLLETSMKPVNQEHLLALFLKDSYNSSTLHLFFCYDSWLYHCKDFL